MFVKDNAGAGETYAQIVQRDNQTIEVTAEENKAEKADEGKEAALLPLVRRAVRRGPRRSELGRARVTRVVSAFDAGRILNHKTARSQAIGGIVFGIGMALMEQTARDPVTGRVVTRNLADYLVPVNADIPEIEILFPDVPDYTFNSTGARGIGEIGITGIAAAIANAVYHATGKRIRELPITPDKLLL